jgi:kinesin family protein 15
VEGLLEKKVNSYRQGIDMLLEGEKTRRMASTAMNNESSRSHAIFTITVETSTTVDDVVKVRKSKLNIVDLAGSERVKHTHVVG